jgi:hypothetical protein
MPSFLYPEDTPIFVWATAEGRYAALTELATAKQRVYAFTTQDKAKTFLRVLRSNDVSVKAFDRLFYCTLKEWFDWQPERNLPDLLIDHDPHELCNSPTLVRADFFKYNLSCVTHDSVNGPTYDVRLEPRNKDTRAA